MDSTPRGEFSSAFGFVMAAAGSAIGLGNIWGFPTQTAQNGGAAFVLFYLILTFLVGYPVLLAEFTIGRYSKSNPVGTYQKIKGGKPFVPVAFLGLLTVGFILSFYSIIAGSMIAYFIEPVLRFVGGDELAKWIISQSIWSNMLFTTLFFFLSILIVIGGVKNGIEKWSSRFMPTLLIMLIILIGYVLTLEGSAEGIKVYLLPDFRKAMDPKLIVRALGQAFFSLSLGVGGMLVYGSYTSKKENLVKLTTLVTLCDVGVAFLAGMLIIPAMYAAAAAGTQIFDTSGNLISQANLIFQVLPALFGTMGSMGTIVSFLFFFLMLIAALTSSIAMLEVPVAYAVDNQNMSRKKASLLIGILFWMVSMIIVFNFNALFNLIVIVTTQYSQPLLGLFICIFVGWVVNRNTIIEELKQGNPGIENSLFIKIWPFFVKVISPILILLVFLQSFF